MNKPKISFACTTFNEEKNIAKFIESILNQSIKPDEIVIVDGGSKDKTVQVIRKYQKKSKISIKLFVIKGNIAKGRNKYVKESKYDILFTGDVGTRFEKNWIKKMLVGFKKNADIVVGTYVAEKPKNSIEKIVASRFPDFSKFTKEDWMKFLPSNRQIAIRKSSWKKLGNFPEWMDRADDTLMHMKAKEIGLKYYFAKKAKVYWKARDNLKQYLKLGYLDSVSDGISGIVWKRKVYYLEFISIILLISSLLLAIFYNKWFIIFWPILLGGIALKEGYNIYKKTRDIKCFFYGGLVMVCLFLTHSIGGIGGLVKRIF